MWTVALGNDKLARVTVGEAELVAEAGRISRSTAGERPVSGTDERSVSGDRERLANGPDATALAELLTTLRDLRAENAELRDRAAGQTAPRASWRLSSGAARTLPRRWPRRRRGLTGSRRRWPKRGGRGWRRCSRGCGARAEAVQEAMVADDEEAKRKRSERARKAS